MKVNDTLIDKLANLAKLNFNLQEKEDIKNDLQRMIQFITKLDEVNTENIAPLLHISSNINVMREDVVEQKITKQEALRNVALKDESFFKVPKVIKK
jgi:aspartyl-tRNA(Asn)/glutamyl-tRNA(Gln) amidotransferase subunit C